ncbi:AfsR/SARP family transcriptional regulator [Kutzneria chonburiensis]|uniref:AfsR/SARP family transcriptional regulator n=1 Tax=Kutzneria chonburiensis TaxID=1483604 RepID=UPI00235DC6DF|nr:helix-turn-helix domain-containing protein [Kutzneria chonburiensis]
MDIVLGILGETALLIDGSFGAEWGRPKERAVLAALATMPGKSMSIDTLSDWVWPDGEEPANLVSTLHTHVGRIRNSLKRWKRRSKF